MAADVEQQDFVLGDLQDEGDAVVEGQAVSLTYSYRITLTLQITEHEILLLDIGSHDEVYG